MHLAVTPLAARRVVIDLAPFVDTMLNPGRVRVLAADGTLSLGDLQLPVTVAERLTSRAGQPDRRSYLVQQQRAGIVRIRTLSTGSADPQLVSLLSRILGRSARPDTASITLTLRR